jgi:hypothetical protein
MGGFYTHWTNRNGKANARNASLLEPRRVVASDAAAGCPGNQRAAKGASFSKCRLRSPWDRLDRFREASRAPRTRASHLPHSTCPSASPPHNRCRRTNRASLPLTPELPQAVATPTTIDNRLSRLKSLHRYVSRVLLRHLLSSSRRSSTRLSTLSRVRRTRSSYISIPIRIAAASLGSSPHVGRRPRAMAENGCPGSTA